MKIFLWILLFVIIVAMLNAIVKLIRERNKLEKDLNQSVKNHDKYLTEEKVRISNAKKLLEEEVNNRDVRLNTQKEVFRKKLRAKDQVIRRRDKRIENLFKQQKTWAKKK